MLFSMGISYFPCNRSTGTITDCVGISYFPCYRSTGTITDCVGIIVTSHATGQQELSQTHNTLQATSIYWVSLRFPLRAQMKHERTSEPSCATMELASSLLHEAKCNVFLVVHWKYFQWQRGSHLHLRASERLRHASPSSIIFFTGVFSFIRPVFAYIQCHRIRWYRKHPIEKDRIFVSYRIIHKKCTGISN